MTNNPLSKEQIDNLKKAKDTLALLDKRIADMKLAKIPITPEFEAEHKDLKDKVAALIQVYGSR